MATILTSTGNPDDQERLQQAIDNANEGDVIILSGTWTLGGRPVDKTYLNLECKDIEQNQKEITALSEYDIDVVRWDSILNK